MYVVSRDGIGFHKMSVGLCSSVIYVHFSRLDVERQFLVRDQEESAGK